MIRNLKVLAVIPARANSKGLPGKNVAALAGRPLIAWSIDAALASTRVDRTVVSTDSEQIARTARQYGADVPFLRPAALAMDSTPGIAPLLHACQMVPGHDLVVLLQPTSPLRLARDIDEAIEHMIDQGADFCLGVTRVKQHPNWLFRMDDQGLLSRYENARMKTDRQSLSPLYAPNGALYVARIPALMEQRTLTGSLTVAHEMSAERSADIDTALDLQICDYLMSKRMQA